MSKNRHHVLSHDELQNKILGGWCGKAFGCMMGEPMEFKAQGEIYEGSLDIDPKAPTIGLHNEDDMYVNMALLEVMREKGLDATGDDYASVFRESDFMLWHANGQARQNLREGVSPGLSGHPIWEMADITKGLCKSIWRIQCRERERANSAGSCRRDYSDVWMFEYAFGHEY